MTLSKVKLTLSETLALAKQVIHWSADPEPPNVENELQGDLYVGVDLGTAYLVLAVLNEEGIPVAGEYQFAQVARDGLIVDFVGAVDLLKEMKECVERRIGRKLTHAASGFPPGVYSAEIRATANVVEAAGFNCTNLVDEPTAANAVLNLDSGVIVDVGGGTTGIAIIKDGDVVYTADEPTGGTHFSLVIAGAHDITFEEAETMKITANKQKGLFPAVRPVMEKVASIISRHIQDFDVSEITLVGGSSAFPGFAEVVSEFTGLPASVPDYPHLVTPLGLALNNSKT